MSVEDTDVIDFVAHDPKGEVVLVMVEGREWDGSSERLFELQEKINNYAAWGTRIQRRPGFWKRRSSSYAPQGCRCL